MRGTPLKKIILLFSALLTVFALASKSQTKTVEAGRASQASEQSRTFFPHNWIRGYTDFSVAPSHNEPDLGRCAFPQPAGAGGTASPCTAYARDRKSTRLNSSHGYISYAVFCLKKKKKK